jgi:energy-coupling factor transporter ATP-binding protein EcfA2
MSRLALILGKSGAGKSTSLRTLNPKETFIINSLGKEIPYEGSADDYTIWNKEHNPDGNVIVTTSATVVLQWMNFISQKMPHIKNIIIDDNTQQSSMEYLRRISESTWDKWNDIAANMINIAQAAKSLRDDLMVFILHHVTEQGDGLLEDKSFKAMTLGKLVDDKLGTYEAYFTVILLAKKLKTKDDDIEYVFLTRDADSTTKTPMGMFSAKTIPNDLNLVRDTVFNYYSKKVKSNK